jgi:hypothetical protein
MLNKIEPKMNSTGRAKYGSSNEQLFCYRMDKPIILIIREVMVAKPSENPVPESKQVLLQVKCFNNAI